MGSEFRNTPNKLFRCRKLSGYNFYSFTELKNVPIIAAVLSINVFITQKSIQFIREID